MLTRVGTCVALLMVALLYCACQVPLGASGTHLSLTGRLGTWVLDDDRFVEMAAERARSTAKSHAEATPESVEGYVTAARVAASKRCKKVTAVLVVNLDGTFEFSEQSVETLTPLPFSRYSGTWSRSVTGLVLSESAASASFAGLESPPWTARLQQEEGEWWLRGGSDLQVTAYPLRRLAPAVPGGWGD